jgi:hypothetical protein
MNKETIAKEATNYRSNYDLFTATKTYVGSVDILYDKNLTVYAKMLFQVIIGLSFKLGFCYATNESLALRLNLSKSTIIKYLKELDKERIIIRVQHKTIYGRRRKIFVNFEELLTRYQ